ncbi:hypothetical protein FRC08_002907 [Ceratobasidium sp. 394]|nr:hypothetical protein FRC08_002907 [Ceratobasidium sp. 394]
MDPSSAYWRTTPTFRRRLFRWSVAGVAIQTTHPGYNIVQHPPSRTHKYIIKLTPAALTPAHPSNHPQTYSISSPHPSTSPRCPLEDLHNALCWLPDVSNHTASRLIRLQYYYS